MRLAQKKACQLCREAASLTVVTVYSTDGLAVCGKCYQIIEAHRDHHYSQVMARVAMVETGYHANRKKAKWINMMCGRGYA